MSNIDIYKYNDKMEECRFKYEHLKERFNAAILSNLCIFVFCFIFYIETLSTSTIVIFPWEVTIAFPIALVLILSFVYVPLSIWAYLKKRPFIYIILAMSCLILSLCFSNLLVLIFSGLNVVYYFLTREIYALKALPEYPLFLPVKTNKK